MQTWNTDRYTNTNIPSVSELTNQASPTQSYSASRRNPSETAQDHPTCSTTISLGSSMDCQTLEVEWKVGSACEEFEDNDGGILD